MEEMAKKYRIHVHTTDDASRMYDCVDFDNNHISLAITVNEGYVISFMLSYIQMFEVKEL